MSVWVSVLLDKFLYGRPSHRLLQDLSDHGLHMSPGTLTGGLHALAPLFAAYFSPSWTPFQADRGRDFSVIVDGVSD